MSKNHFQNNVNITKYIHNSDSMNSKLVTDVALLVFS